MKRFLATTLLLLTIVINSKAQVENISSGTGSAYTLNVPGIFSLRNGIEVTFKAHANNVAAPSINVSGSGPIAILKNGGTTALDASDIKAGQIVTLAYDGSKWQMMNPIATPPAAPTTYWSPSGSDIYNNNVGAVLVDGANFDGAYKVSFGKNASSVEKVLSLTNQNNFVGGGTSLGFRSNFGGTMWDQALISGITGASSASGDLAFSVMNNRTASTIIEVMRIQGSSGYIGIGTASPSAKLHLEGSLRLNNLSGTAPAIGSVLTSIDAQGNTEWAPPALTTTYWNPSGSDIYNNNGGNVGIGNGGNPIFNKLLLQGNVGTSTNTGVFMDIHNTNGVSNAMSGIRFKVNGLTGTDERFQAAIWHRWNTDYELAFAVRDNNAVTNVSTSDIKMVVKNTGTVGIGTTTPSSSLLHVHATSGSGNLRLTSASTGATASDGFSISNDGTTNLFMTQHENADWYFSTNGGTTAMTIAPSGKVGIGTISPSAQLEVQNSTASATEKIGVFGTVTGTGGGANVGVRGYATGSTLSNYGVNANAYGNSGTKYGVYSAATGTGTNYAGYFSASGGTTNYAIVVPSGGGNVGIGTSPSFPLDVRTSTEDRVGYFFNSTNTTNNTFGIYAGAHGTGSGEKRGGSFEAVNGTGTNIGVRGMASGGAVNWAGYFDVGNVFISENLGIGVTPGYKLHVQLASTGTLAYFDNNSTAGGTALNANVNTTAVSAGTRYGLNTTAWYGQGINYGVYTYGYGGTTSYGIYATSGGATTNYAGYFNTGDVYIDNNLGIGIPAPTYQIQLSTNSAAKPSSNTWTVASDARLKTNIQEYSEGLKEVLAIHPIWFTYTGEAGMPKETGVGVLAQELQKVAPHMVKDWTYVPSKKEKIAEDGTEIPNGAKAEDVLVPDYTNAKTYLAVDNGAMTYMLINAIKEQQKMIEELKREIDALKNK